MPELRVEWFRAVRDLWREDKPGFAWGVGMGLLLFWSVTYLRNASGPVRTIGTALGVAGGILFVVGMAFWIAYTPRRRAQAKRPDQP